MLVDFRETLIDTPGIGIVAFFKGCNFDCKYCHNKELISFPTVNQKSKLLDFKKFISKKEIQLFVDYICFTGGEPLLSRDFRDSLFFSFNKGFKIVLDTNGSLPIELKKYFPLLFQVKLDIKTSIRKYKLFFGFENMLNFIETFNFLKHKEQTIFRTTLDEDYVSIEDLKEIIELIPKNKKLILQSKKQKSKKYLNYLEEIKKIGIIEKKVDYNWLLK